MHGKQNKKHEINAELVTTHQMTTTGIVDSSSSSSGHNFTCRSLDRDRRVVNNSDSLFAFKTFYVNKFIDYHAHEIILAVINVIKQFYRVILNNSQAKGMHIVPIVKGKYNGGEHPAGCGQWASVSSEETGARELRAWVSCLKYLGGVKQNGGEQGGLCWPDVSGRAGRGQR